ncbi:MAG TPA: alpha/beta hydrolase-fold protein [Gaiellales bacterium]|nr:alpha/beta hydrolase-fold protein [Gaiellales bacterium]
MGGGVFAVVGAGAVASGVVPGRSRLKADLKDQYHAWFSPHPHIPDAPEGEIRLEQVRSQARGKTVDLFTAVPHGHGDGAGLPVCVILHGVSATPKDYQGFGLGKFLTAAVERGAPPFVLAGADGGVLYWEPDPAGGDDPQRMMTEEMPRWLAARGFDARRIAGWGWSMGGYGVLRLGEVRTGWLRAVAAFSPDVTHSASVANDDGVYRTTPLGVWCGRSDPLYDDVRAFVAQLPRRPRVLSYGDGAHTRAYWDSVTLPAFAFVAGELEKAA